jgi:hypothetical protein
MGLRGTQLMSFIIYTPRFYQNYRFRSNLKSLNLRLDQSLTSLNFQIFDLVFEYLSLYCLARGFDEQA